MSPLSLGGSSYFLWKRCVVFQQKMKNSFYLPSQSPRLLFVAEHRIAWVAEIAASQIVADRKGNAFIVKKIVKNCYAFSYYHCYLSSFALLTIKLRK